jgi:hypothetical protein
VPKGRKSDSCRRRCATAPNAIVRLIARATLPGDAAALARDNPYENDSREARAWIMGLLDGRNKQLTVVPTASQEDC